MIDPAVLRAMLNAGCTADQIVAVAEDAARAEEVKKIEKRAKDAERQRRRRSRHAESAMSRVTECDGEDNPSPKKETSPTPPKEKTTPSSSGDKSPSRCDRDFFAEFWLAYPSREGSNPKKPASERFNRLVAKGHDPEAIIAAARQLANEHPTPTRFVPQAVTWLNQERFADAAPVMSGDEFCSDDWPNTRFLLIRFRQEHGGSDPPRAVHGGKAGYLLPKEWVELSKQRQVANA